MRMINNVYNNILDTIGHTPMLELTKFNTGKCQLFLKLENLNPGGSIKDRMALSMILAAENKGLIKPGDTIVEATAGNTGIGLALVASQKGYNLVLVVPDKTSIEKINNLKAMGAEIIITRSDVGKGHPEYYEDLARRWAEEKGYYFINQFENPANPYAHETTTAPEILEQMEGKVDAIVVGVGSSGTLSGLTAYFKVHSPETKFILADPEGSILADYINKNILKTKAGNWLVEGIGKDAIPPICDFSMTKKSYSISDRESFATVRELLKREGIFAGASTGTLLAGALRYCNEQSKSQRIVSFVCDSGNKYLSKVYNNEWLIEKGLI